MLIELVTNIECVENTTNICNKTDFVNQQQYNNINNETVNFVKTTFKQLSEYSLICLGVTVFATSALTGLLTIICYGLNMLSLGLYVKTIVALQTIGVFGIMLYSLGFIQFCLCEIWKFK